MDKNFLMRFIPNYIAPGYDEKPLIEKIEPFVADAESFVDRFVISRDLIQKFPNLQRLAEPIVALHALSHAAPALNVTMHPNGLAVVNTDSLAPASAERSKAFIDSLNKLMIQKIDDTVRQLIQIEEFRQSKPARRFWLATVFDSAAELIEYCKIPYCWDSFISAFHKIRQIEISLAYDYISLELMRLLQRKSFDARRIDLLEQIAANVKYVVAECLNSEIINQSMILLSVNLIKNNIDMFPEWEYSETAKLFSPPKFRNKKNSGGYFF